MERGQLAREVHRNCSEKRERRTGRHNLHCNEISLLHATNGA